MSDQFEAIYDDKAADQSFQDFDTELDPLLFDGPSLPADFSRTDIYADHD